MKFTDVYTQVLNTMQSTILAELSDADIIAYLDELMIRAIADFSFPYVALDYVYNVDEYEFTNDITQREVNVLIVMIKSFWLEQNIDNDSLFGLVYFDRDVKTYSAGNKIKAIQARFELSKDEIKKALYHYYAVNEAEPEIGNLYDD